MRFLTSLSELFFSQISFIAIEGKCRNYLIPIGFPATHSILSASVNCHSIVVESSKKKETINGTKADKSATQVNLMISGIRNNKWKNKTKNKMMKENISK